MRYIVDILKGILIGFGAILPGISSGVILVILGIYEDLLNATLGFFKDIRKNARILIPIIIGILIGTILFSNVLNYLFETYDFESKSIFIGLILRKYT